MPLMQWSPNLSVGIDFMDADHKQMMSVINELHDITATRRKEDIVATLDELIRVTTAHFQREEHFMQAHGYRWYKQHQRSHQALLEELAEFRERTVTEDMELGQELTRFLDQWLLSHILESDKHLGGFLEGVGSRG